MLLVACGSHHDAPAVPPGKLETRVVGEPVHVARAWTTALAPNARGGWNFITQTYELDSPAPTEFVVVDLATGNTRITEGPSGIYANSNYQIAEQLRAANGRIFFPELEGHLAYYDPADETVKQLGKIVGDKAIYRMVFGPDGKLYGGTQSNGLPTVFQLDPDTLKVRVLGTVGEHRLTYSYAYYLAADPPWLYVAVGENPWELVALDMRTGRSQVLATRPGDGFMQLDTRPEGISATLITALRTPQQKTDRVWLVDGKLLPFDPAARGKLAFKPRDVRPRDNPIRNAPALDLSAVTPDAHGIGKIAIKRGAAVEHRAFRVQHVSAVDIESLIALPDGSILGNAKQYHGFFRYRPGEKAIESYGPAQLSGGPRAEMNGIVYVSGYPNGVLYAFDPRKPWGASNPQLLGNFTQAGAKYAYFLVASKNGRLYFAGRRERDGDGGGVGYYEPATHTFGGHHDGLATLDPQGFAVLDGPGWVVYSGRLRADPAQAASEAQLVVFDRDLKELARLTVKPGLANTGLLFPTGEPSVVLGVIRDQRVVYRYDVAARRLLDWKQLDVPLVAPTQRASDGSIWLFAGARLARVDPKTLALTDVGDVAAPGPDDLLTWQGDKLFWASHSELRELTVPR